MKIKKVSAMASGKLIALEGTDGSGKTTQWRMLLARLRREGFATARADFPRYKKPTGDVIARHLRGEFGILRPEAASILYAVDRFDAGYGIRRQLRAGKIIVSNRYVTSNAAHQGGKIADDGDRETFFLWLRWLEHEVLQVPVPDLNIILHMPAEVAQSLIDKKAASQRHYANGKKRDIYEADLGHLKAAERTYLQVAETFPNTVLIKCFVKGKLLSPQAVHERVWAHVAKLIR